METWFYFFLQKESSVAEGLEELLSYGAMDLSVLEDMEEDKIYLCGKINKGSMPLQWMHIEYCTPLEENINWVEQWEMFCPYFSEGICKIPLANFSAKSEKQLLLLPGAGFGDLSHPTTCLMMELMDSYVEDKILVDLGCGSGVLGLFALLLGAEKVYGLDIDRNALEHTKENAKLNDLQDKVLVSSFLPKDVNPEVTLLNMTWDEQKQALSSFPVNKCDVWITSGILQEQEKEYLLFMEKFFLKVQKVKEKEGWLGFVFTRYE